MDTTESLTRLMDLLAAVRRAMPNSQEVETLDLLWGDYQRTLLEIVASEKELGDCLILVVEGSSTESAEAWRRVRSLEAKIDRLTKVMDGLSSSMDTANEALLRSILDQHS